MTKILRLFIILMIMQNIVKADEKIIWKDISCKEFYKKYEPNKNIKTLDLKYTNYCENPKEAVLKTNEFAKAYKILFNSTINLMKLYNDEKMIQHIYFLNKNEIKILIESPECEAHSLIIFKKINNKIHIFMSSFDC